MGRPDDRHCEPPVRLELGGPRPVVNMRLGSGPEVPALFDTGATTSVINLDQAAALGLHQTGPLGPPFDRMHGDDGYQILAKGLSVGGILIGDVSLPALRSPLRNVAAVLGPSIFGDRLVNLDFGAATLTVCDKRAETIPGEPPQRFSEGPLSLPTVLVAIGGVQLQAVADSGSPMGLAFPASFADRLPLHGPLEAAGEARGHAGSSPVLKGRIRGEVRVGPLLLADPEVMFTNVVRAPNVGMKLLRELRVTIDATARRNWVGLSRNASPTAAPGQ